MSSVHELQWTEFGSYWPRNSSCSPAPLVNHSNHDSCTDARYRRRDAKNRINLNAGELFEITEIGTAEATSSK